jgi:2-octaprenyl-6-methoxyphenol hydroxylase
MAVLAETGCEINADIAIAGSGIAGGALACLLAEAGLRVALIDRAPDSVRLDTAYDGRTTAISYASRHLVEAAGLWEDLAPFASPIEQIRIADGASPLFLHFAHEAVEGRPFGWIVENRLIRKALAGRLASLPNITMLAPATVTAFTAAGRAVLTLEDGRRVSAPLAVGADGKASTLRGLAGIATGHHDYAQTALVFVIAHQHSHGQVAVEHFQPAGPFAVLPMCDDETGRHRSSVVWSLETPEAERLMALPDAAFETEIAPLFADYWGGVGLGGRRFAYPLQLTYAKTGIAARLALVADAFHGIHPIAGQGLNLGLRDVALLAELVVDAARLGLDIGAPSLLRRYDAARAGDNGRMIFATDALNRLFSNDVAPVRLARAAGLGVVQQSPALKRFFMLTAMGLTGDTPRLIRGKGL